MRIPGRALEIRYHRTGPDRGPYTHVFTSPVRMIARRDGTVVLKGRGRVWADEDSPGFSRYHRRRRSSTTMTRRYRRNPGNGSRGGTSWTPLLLIGGAIWLLSRPGGLSSIFPAGTRYPWSAQPQDLGAQFQAQLVRAGGTVASQTIASTTGLVDHTVANWFQTLQSGQTPAGVTNDQLAAQAAQVEALVAPTQADMVQQAVAAPIIGVGSDMIATAPVPLDTGQAAAAVDQALALAI